MDLLSQSSATTTWSYDPYRGTFGNPNANLVSGMAWLQSTSTMPRKLRLEYPRSPTYLPFRRAWSIGGETFRRECLEQMEGKVRGKAPRPRNVGS